MSGIERGGQLRFLTLTSSKDSPDTCQRAFRALYMRLKRRGLMHAYIKIPEPSKNHKQHLHVLFRGEFIEQWLISIWWEELHKAKVIDIRKVNYGASKRRLASYMAKYLSKDNMYRFSWSWSWVWRGFVKDWQNLKRQWREYNAKYHPKSYQWLLTQWYICLAYNLRPMSLEPLEPP